MPQPYTPTPEEIRIACWAIQTEWDEKERLSRIVDDKLRRQMSGWRAGNPVLSASEVPEDESEGEE